jgi:acetate---CoA ligase (ADP-forming)
MTESLEELFRPKRVAIVGASGTPGKWGYFVLRTLLDGGFTGEVAAVNGRGGEVQGCPAFATVADLPWAPDLALVVVGREAAVDAVEALALRRCRHVIVHAAGFAETGPEGAALERRMLAAARAAGMRLLGPNCMNLMVAESRLNLTGIPDLRSGALAFVSQSGNLVYDLVEHGRASGLGLSAFVSVGNQADLGVEDFLDWLAEDPETAAVALYVEALRPGTGPRFLAAARRLTARKPMLALIGGRTAPGRSAAASHTASLLGDVRVLRGFLRQAGVIEVGRLDELFPVADALIQSPSPPVPTAALCGGGGGHATVGSDALARHGIVLPRPSPETQGALRAIFPPMASVRNPVDWVGASERSFWAYRDAARLLLADPGIGGVILFGHFGGYLTERETPADNYRDVAVALAELQRATGKPLFVHSIYARQPRAAFDALRAGGVPLFDSLETAAAAFRALADHGRNAVRAPLPAAGVSGDDCLAPHARLARRARAPGAPAPVGADRRGGRRVRAGGRPPRRAQARLRRGPAQVRRGRGPARARRRHGGTAGLRGASQYRRRLSRRARRPDG